MTLEGQMKLIHWILVLLLIIAACTVILLFGPEPSGSTGVAHEEFTAMRAGGDGATRFLPVRMSVLILQSASILLFGALLYLGVDERRRTRQCKAWIISGTVAFLLIWGAILASYGRFLEMGSSEMFLGFPVATAFTVYGLWLCGFVLVLGYVIGFRTFIFSADDEARYKKLVETFGRDRRQP
jgi:hypothetical protein